MPPTLIPGTRLGPFEITSRLGVGGMGEVYRARDTKLNRDVAIKVILPAVANDPDRLARFSREAQVLASLNHPNIAHIHGIEESNGVTALVMELVEGEELSQRIARGRVPLDEALLIARQIVEALEAAHEQGVIHRDLKPANIKVRDDGMVKVLDFGLAKATEPASGTSLDVTDSPTVASPAMMTGIGVILGTAAYMSPEQAVGKAVDKRSDLWAFGVVVFEMLTGRPVFSGETVSHILAAVLTSEPDWTALPARTPAPIRRLLRRCLDKDRRRRLADAADARLEIEDALAASAAVDEVPFVTAPRRAIAVASVALLVGVVLAATATWVLRRPALAPLQPMRLSIVPPAALPLAIAGFDRDLALSPDGTRLVYVSIAGQVMVRAIDQLEAVPLGGITGARSPFFSPDGLWVGFFWGGAEGGELKKVPIAGGPPLSLCRYSGAPRGASWGSDDTIVFATADTSSGLFRVSAAGGTPTILTTPDAAPDNADHLFPSVLSGGRAVLFTIASEAAIDTAQVAVLDLSTGHHTILVRGGSQAEYVEPGYLVYGVAGALRAVRFDPRSLTVGSEPVPVVEQVRTLPTGAAEFSVSRQGALLYVPGGATGATRSLVWVTRQGQETPIPSPPRAYVFPRISPDGTRVALDIREQDTSIWIADLARQTLNRLTDTPRPAMYPVWTPDSRRIIFAARADNINLFWRAADNTGPVGRLTTSLNTQFPTAIAPDGTRVILRENVPTTGLELRVLALQGSSGPADLPAPTVAAGPRQSERLAQTPLNGINGEVSPDGHWLAYQSNESGQNQISVRPFPNVDGGHWAISTNGGTRPVWARSGEELFYLDGTNAMMAASVHTTPTFRFDTPTKLFDGRYYANEDGRTYDVSTDGQRFLMIKPIATGDQKSSPASMVVVLNWTEELKRLVLTR